MRLISTSERFLAFSEQRSLLGNLSQRPQHTLITVEEAKECVRGAHFLAGILQYCLRAAQIMARDAGKDVDDLELQASIGRNQAKGDIRYP